MNTYQPITSLVVPLRRDHVDTDQIIPAEYLKVTTKSGLGAHVFSNWRQEPDFVLNQPRYQGAQILLAGVNFGCGSSREHAPWALHDYGFRVIIAESFADIFKNNAMKNDLLPIALPPAILEQLADATVTVDLVAQTIQWADQQIHFDIDPFNKLRLVTGLDDLGYTMQFNDFITQYEQAHPRSAR